MFIVGKNRTFVSNKTSVIMEEKKSKETDQTQQPLSPESFLREKARGLEIGKCFVSRDITAYGIGHVVVSRLHKTGKVSAAFFLVDIYCVGVRESFYRLHLDEYEFEKYIDLMRNENIQECSYEEAHNWIYGAINFAIVAGIQPDKSFDLTQYMLEEDTDEVPLIEYEFGRNGKHFLVAKNKLEASRYLPFMKANLGDNFDVLIDDLDDFDEEEDDEEEEDDDEPYTLIETQYTYQHPQYPQVLNVENQWIVPELCDPKNAIAPDDNLIDRILALPHDSLRRDLENLILYYTGLTCDHLPNEDSEDFNGVIGTSMMLLAEVGNEDSSLDVVLEVLRQSPKFCDYHICDGGDDTSVATIYKLGQHKLDKLMAFAKEEGLYSLSKSCVLSAVTQIANYQPKRRDEVIEWFREIIQFVFEKLPNPQFFDSELLGDIIHELTEIQAKELLKEIRALFDTGYVDTFFISNSNYKEVEEDILDPEYTLDNIYLLDIHERFHHKKALMKA